MTFLETFHLSSYLDTLFSYDLTSVRRRFISMNHRSLVKCCYLP